MQNHTSPLYTTESRVAVLENEVELIRKSIDKIHSSQKEILNSYNKHDVESEHYRTLIDELIAEKKVKTASEKAKLEARSAIVDKLITAGILSSMGIILALAWSGLTDKLTNGG